MSVAESVLSLDELLVQVRPGVLGLCYRLVGSIEDAEDLTQETLLRLAQAYNRFEGRSSFKTWAYRAATNLCYNFLRSARVRRETVTPDPLATSDEFLASVDPEADCEAIRESLEFSFVCVLQELSPLQRIVVVLRDVLGWSVGQAAEALSSSPAAVKNIHSRATRRLRAIHPKRQTLPPSDPQAQKVMWELAAILIRGDADACAQYYDEDSEHHVFPIGKVRGRQAIRDCWESLLSHPPTIFMGVKMNGSLGAACYHPNEQGALRQTGVLIFEVEKPKTLRARPVVSRSFIAFQPEHYQRAPVPEEMPIPADLESRPIL